MLLASLLGARTLLGAPGRTTRSKDATRPSGQRARASGAGGRDSRGDPATVFGA